MVFRQAFWFKFFVRIWIIITIKCMIELDIRHFYACLLEKYSFQNIDCWCVNA